MQGKIKYLLRLLKIYNNTVSRINYKSAWNEFIGRITISPSGCFDLDSGVERELYSMTSFFAAR